MLRGEHGETLVTKSSRLTVLRKDSSIVVRKTALERGKGDIQAQIHALKNLPASILASYPRLLAADSASSPMWYEMPFYPFPSMRELVFEESTPLRELKVAIDNLLEFLFERLYCWKTGPVSPDFVEQVYKRRMLGRLAEVTEQDPLLADAISAREVVFAGRSFPSPTKQLERILDRIGARSLCPPGLCSTHGQLEFDHILLGSKDLREPTLTLLDTSGVQALSDAAYDLGKLMQSLRSKVDLIKQNLFEMVFDVRPGILSADLAFPNPRLGVSDELAHLAIQEFGRVAGSTRDPNLVMRTEFATAVHLCSALPYYYEPTIEGRRKALAFYIQGAVEFDRFSQSYVS